jgi:hypothetical protein
MPRGANFWSVRRKVDSSFFRVGASRVATPSFFAIRAEKISSSLCGAVYVNTDHVVENDQREEWENLTAKEGTKMADDAIAAIAEYELGGLANYNYGSYTAWNIIFDYDEYNKVNKVCKASNSDRTVLLSILHLIRLFVM